MDAVNPDVLPIGLAHLLRGSYGFGDNLQADAQKGQLFRAAGLDDYRCTVFEEKRSFHVHHYVKTMIINNH